MHAALKNAEVSIFLCMISYSNTNQGYRDLLLSLLQGHLRDVACNPQSSSYYTNLAKCGSRRATWLPMDTWPLSNPIFLTMPRSIIK